MSGITRRFTYFPDAATIKRIEGIIIVDAAPAGTVQEAEAGTVCLIGETEDGGFMTDSPKPVDVYHLGGGPLNIPGGKWQEVLGTFGFTINGQKSQHPCARRSDGEFWNGNAYVQAKGLAFRKFYMGRVDTSVGSVTFSPMAFLESSSAQNWALTTGQTLVLSINGGADRTATFTGTKASHTGAAGAFGTIVAGDTLTLSIDSGAFFTVEFRTGDTTVALCIDRINAAAGSPIAILSGGQIKIESGTGGLSSKVIISASGGAVKLGLTAGTYNGAGNVQNIGSVTAAEVKTIVEALVDNPKIRITDAGKIRVCSPLGSTGTIRVQASSTATAFGFTTASTVSASSGTQATTIPAGTLCKGNAAGVLSRVVTMQTLSIPASTTAAISVKVRPAQDDGTFLGYVAATIDTIETVPSGTSEWVVNNASALTAALTTAQKDAAYEAAIRQSLALTGAAKKFNYIVSARQSAVVRAALRTNALNASSKAYGRKAVISPPIGTSLATMQTSASPGVGTYRAERVVYCPGWTKYISEIAALGAALGGAGFTDDGLVEVHGDIVAASVMSLLNPEENPAQATSFIPRDLYVGVENAIVSWGEDEYAAAKAAGIMAPCYDENEGPGFMSGVTSVDPLAYPSQAPVARVRFADFLTDSVQEFQKPYVKLPATETRKALLQGKLEEFLQGLQDVERVEKFKVSEGQKPAANTYLLNWAVEMIDSLDNIINATSIGEGAISTSRVA